MLHLSKRRIKVTVVININSPSLDCLHCCTNVIENMFGIKLADAADIENPELSIDLVSQTIRRPNGVTISFEVDAFRKKCLLEGLDDIGLTMEKSSAIDSFEAARSQSQPWL